MRISPVEPGSRPELATLEAEIAKQRGRVSPLYQVLLNSPPMAHGWEQLLTAVRRHNSLPEAARELVILRVAVLNRARYEYDAHVPIALQAGASQAAVDALSDPAAIGPGLSADEALLIELTDAMTNSIEVPAALYQRVSARFTPQQVVDAMVTVGAYNMVSRFLVALEIGH
ncbi:carboxymuconolactone decarboxylase family protein [Variovorax sp. W2I14]|uniref:carboxymuconolactone decarboxylase family protein n=1 Tax=Variovorax sp. W2I14 TaxID=3042290 RepID=UPI003D220D42